jgi:hypothetical protein
MRSRPSVVVLGLFVLLFDLTGCIHTRVVEDGALQADGLEKVGRETVALRQLPFERPVPSEAVSAAESKAYLTEFLERRARAIEAETWFYQRLGLLEGDRSMMDVYKRLYTSGAVGGYYVHDEGGRLFVATDTDLFTKLQLESIGWLTGTDWAYELVLSHELVHALQDQHFDLEALSGDHVELYNEDLALARSIIVESDAGITGWAHFHGIDLSGWLERRLHAGYIALNYGVFLLAPGFFLGGAPNFVARKSVDKYVRGLPYVVRALDEGGFAALDARYAEGLVESTEQLFFPERRKGEPGYDPPVRLAPLHARDLRPALEGPWLVMRSNVFGYLQWSYYFDELLGLFNRHHGAVAESGWGGDRYELLWNPESKRTALLWRTQWDDELAAGAFMRAYGEILERKYGSALKPLEGEPPSDRRLWSLPGDGEVADGHVWLERRGARVLIVEDLSGGREQVAGVVDALWQSYEMPLPEPDTLESWAGTSPGEPGRTPFSPEPAAPRGPADAVLTLDEPVPEAARRRVPLSGRIALPRRWMSWASGLRFAESPDEVPDLATARTFPDGELRWGLRDGLEYAYPLTLTFSAEHILGMSAVSAGLDDLGLSSVGGGVAKPRFRVTHAAALGDDVLLAAQLGAVGELWLDLPQTSFMQLSMAGGGFARPWERLTLHFSVGRETIVGLAPVFEPGAALRHDGGVLVLGSAMRRGAGFRQPLVELELLDVLHLWGSAHMRMTTPVEQGYAAGLMLYF